MSVFFWIGMVCFLSAFACYGLLPSGMLWDLLSHVLVFLSATSLAYWAWGAGWRDE